MATDEGFFPLPGHLAGAGLFLLKVTGDAMSGASIIDGDWVIVRSQPNAADGQVVAAMADGEAVVRIIRQVDGHAWLMPDNPAYVPFRGSRATILGTVVTVIRDITCLGIGEGASLRP